MHQIRCALNVDDARAGGDHAVLFRRENLVELGAQSAEEGFHFLGADICNLR